MVALLAALVNVLAPTISWVLYHHETHTTNDAKRHGTRGEALHDTKGRTMRWLEASQQGFMAQRQDLYGVS